METMEVVKWTLEIYMEMARAQKMMEKSLSVVVKWTPEICMDDGSGTESDDKELEHGSELDPGDFEGAYLKVKL